MQRSNIVYMGCDVNACYNRILPIVLLLAYVKARMPYKTAVFFIRLLYNMQCIITTAFGVGCKVNCLN